MLMDLYHTSLFSLPLKGMESTSIGQKSFNQWYGGLCHLVAGTDIHQLAGIDI